MEAIAIKIFCLLIGGAGIWTGFRQLKNWAVLNRWQTTSGKVTERGIYQPNDASLANRAFSYAPLVRYSYRVGDQNYISNDIRPRRIQLPERNKPEWAQKRAESFPDDVTVHYNPDDPAEAFLMQTSKKWLYLVIGVSILIILYGFIFF